MITVFTATYNREKTLCRLYESLICQTSFDFEWLIVDDGSTDDTCRIVHEFSNSDFPIRYVFKKNGGKHSAYNLAIQEARGLYFLCVDSDDWLVPDAIEQICRAAIPEIGLCAYKADIDGKRLSSPFPAHAEATSTFELYARLKCSGEYTFVYPTRIVRQIPFPVFPGERFVTESVIYDRLDRLCKVKLLPSVITICEYQPDGYSAGTNRLMRENPAGYCLYFMQRIDLVSGLLNRLVTAGKYQCFGILAGENRSGYQGKHRLFTSLCYPVGLLFFIYYKICRGF